MIILLYHLHKLKTIVNALLLKLTRLVKASSHFELNVDWAGDCGIINYGAAKGVHLAHYHLVASRITVIMVATSSFWRSGSSSFLILAI